MYLLSIIEGQTHTGERRITAFGDVSPDPNYPAIVRVAHFPDRPKGPGRASCRDYITIWEPESWT